MLFWIHSYSNFNIITIGGYVSIWGSENTYVTYSQCTHYEAESYFFENEDGTTITINRDTYCTMITSWYWIDVMVRIV